MSEAMKKETSESTAIQQEAFEEKVELLETKQLEHLGYFN